MNILEALKNEEKRLQQQLIGIQNAILALNGRSSLVRRGRLAQLTSPRQKRTLSAAARAKISQAAKARWARVRQRACLFRSGGDVPLSVPSKTMWIVCPRLASGGTWNDVFRESADEKVMSPGYVPASLYCHHLTLTEFPSGSEV